MKKIVKYLVAAIAMVAAVSCQKELVEEKAPVKDGDSYVFTASLKPATKTVLNIDEETGVMKSQWWAGAKGKEYINVMDDREVNNKYASANLQEAADKTDFSLDEGADFYGTEVFAVYPYHANNAYWKGEEGEIGVVADFKQIQTATSGNYDPTAPVHVAYNPDITASTNLVFSNLSALVKFDVTTDFVRTITLSGLNGEMVSGPMVYKYANGKYTLEDSTDGYVEVTLTAAPYGYANGNGNAEQNYFAKGAHYLAIVPGTFEKGIQITLNAGLENPITFTHNDPITLRPGTVNDFGAFGTDKNLDWGVAKVGEEEKAQKLEYKDGYFVGTVALTQDESYKIVASQEDYDASNYGLSFPREYAPVGKYDLATGEAGYEIRVDKTGEYDVMFSTGLSVLYLLDKGAAADEELDLSKVGTPDPVRSITGSFVGGAERIAMTAVKDSKGNTTHFEAVVEFLSTDEERALYLRDGSSNLITYGCDADEFEFKDGVSFASVVNGDEIVVPDPETDEETGEPVAESVYYVVEQSYDGMTITITTPDTPDGAQWAFKYAMLNNAPGLFDFGVTFENQAVWVHDYDAALAMGMPDTYGIEGKGYFYNALDPNLPFTYRFVPTGFTSGEVYASFDGGETWNENPYLTYTKFDGQSFSAVCPNITYDMTPFTATLVPETDNCPIYCLTPEGMHFVIEEEEVPFMTLDFGRFEEGVVYILYNDWDDVSIAYYKDSDAMPFEITPTSFTEGEVTIMMPSPIGPQLVTMNYSFTNATNVVFDCPDINLYDTAAVAITEDEDLITFKPYLSPLGKQWLLPATLAADDFIVGEETPSVLDLGVTKEDYLLYAISLEEIYGEDAAGEWAQYGQSGNITVEQFTHMSGVILMETYNHFEELVTIEIPYFDLTETSCTFDLSDLLSVEGEFTAEVVEEVVPITLQGIAQ